MFTDIETRVDSSSINIEYLEPSILYIKNKNLINLTYTNIKIDDIMCGINGSIAPNGIYTIDLGTCLSGVAIGPKEVILYTTLGVFSQTKMLKAVLSVNGNLSVSFDLGTSCLTGGYTKIYGLESINDSHVENVISNLYAYSICINHNTYTLGTSCSGTRLFYLDNSTNAHVYTDNSTSYFPVSTWEEVCVSSSGGIITTSVSSSDPADGSICIGSMENPINNIAGMHMGTCIGSYTNKIWLKIQ